MAENILSSFSNFCIGPQAGTYCTVNYLTSPVTMQIKNSSGTLINTYTFSPSTTLEAGPYSYEDDAQAGTETHYEFVDIKYVGPTSQNSSYDGAIFYTLEKIGTGLREYYTYDRNSSGELITDDDGNLETDIEIEYSGNIIRKWTLDASDLTLDLVSSYYKTEDDDYWYGADAFAIKTIETTLTSAVSAGIGELELATSSGISKYDTVLIGPSSDTDNTGYVEEAYVHAVSDNTITIKTYSGTTPPVYEYVSGDPVTIIKEVYLPCSPRPNITSDYIRDGYETDYGVLYLLDQTNYGEVSASLHSGLYADVTNVDWSNDLATLSIVKGLNLVHVNIDTGLPIKSQKLTLLTADKSAYLTLYGLDVDGTDIYLLQDTQVTVDDDGNSTEDSWDTYNYVLDTMEPYTSSVTMSAPKNILGYQEAVTITAYVRDQFAVALSDQTVTFSISGDSDGTLEPSDGVTTTDSDGMCTVQYTPSADYQDTTLILASSDGGNPNSGSSYVVANILFSIKSYYAMDFVIMTASDDEAGTTEIFTQSNSYDTYTYLTNFVRCSFPGGEWVWTGEWKDLDSPTILDRNETTTDDDNAIITTVYQPFLSGLPVKYSESAGTYVLSDSTNSVFPCTIMSQNLDVDNTVQLKTDALATDTRYLSQNYLSRHTDSGQTVTADLNQFIFVQEALPEFYSEKNTTTIYYWIRLRPYAFSLNPDTLAIYIYEVSYDGTSTTTNIAPLGEITTFDAGSDLDGVEFSYTFPEAFHHNATVYVEVEVYDEAATPNLLTTSYWFKIIEDYNAPYITNKVPAEDATGVALNTPISFYIIDNGEGVDIDTLEVYINSRSVSFTADNYEDHNYIITCNNAQTFTYGEQVQLDVSVTDLAENENTLHEGWVFTCADSTGPWFNDDNLAPGECLKGMSLNTSDVSMQVYATSDTGIAYDSIKLEVGGKYRKIKITPIIYRLK